MTRRHALIVLLSLVLTACSGLAGEPQIVSTIPPPTPQPTDVGLPVSVPNLALGAEIFAARCAECHGLTGAGDGELVQSGQVVNAGNFRLPETASGQRPTDWFATITNGRLENLMPPWRDALTEPERWAVAYYTYTQHYDASDLERGRELYATNCAECHGESGFGDGERAAELSGPVGDLTDAAAMSDLSDDVIYNIITEGIGDPNDGMPAFADVIDEADRLSLARYTRTLSLTAARAAAQPISTEEAEATAEAGVPGTINGVVSNGTAGGTLPDTLDVEIFALDETFTLIAQFNTATDSSGAYTVADVPVQQTGRYIARTTYRDRIYTSAITPGTAFEGTTLNLPITVYDLTEDPSVLTIDGIVSQITVAGDSLQILQVFNITNTSDRAFSTSAVTDDARPISVIISLPPGALVMGFGEQGRYIVTEDQTAVIDTLPVLPGEGHLIEVIYIVQYSGDAIIEQPLNYPLNGQVRLLVRPPNTGVRSEQLPALGLETVGASEYAAYGAALTLNAGAVISYQVSGQGIPLSESGQPLVIDQGGLPLVIILGIGLEILLVIGLIVWYRRRRANAAQQPSSNPNAALIDALVKQIAELDADYEAGKIAQEAYERQREMLKARLTELMMQERGG